MSFSSLVLFLGSGKLALLKWDAGAIWTALVYGYLSIYGMVLIGFSQMDAYCRFQNYKLAKDLFFENRQSRQQCIRIANLFSISRCQREAVLVAASDLGWGPELSHHFYQSGYRWYHLIPDRVIEKPKRLLTKTYWKKTLFVPHYTSKHFLW